MPEPDASPDPLAEVYGHVDHLVRLTAMSGTQVAERALQRRVQAEETARQAAADQVRQMAERERAQHHLARLLWRRAFDDRWWEQATDQQIARTYEAAFVYAGVDLGAADALVRMAEELDHRFLVEQRTDASAQAGHDLLHEAAVDLDGDAIPEVTGERVRELIERMRVETGLRSETANQGPASGSVLVTDEQVAAELSSRQVDGHVVLGMDS